MSRLPTDHLSIVLADSRLRRIVRGIADTWSAARRSSRAAQASRVALARWHSWPDADRLRFIAIVVASAGVWHMAAWLLLPRYITSGLPVLWWSMAGVAAAIAVWAEPVSAAWKASALRSRLKA